MSKKSRLNDHILQQSYHYFFNKQYQFINFLLSAIYAQYSVHYLNLQSIKYMRFFSPI